MEETKQESPKQKRNYTARSVETGYFGFKIYLPVKTPYGFLCRFTPPEGSAITQKSKLLSSATKDRASQDIRRWIRDELLPKIQKETARGEKIFKDCVDEFCLSMKGVLHQKEPRTILGYKAALIHHCAKFYNTPTMIGAITLPMIEEVLNQAKNGNHKEDRPLNTNTSHKILTQLGKFWRWCEGRKYCESIIPKKNSIPKQAPKRETAYSADEMRAIIANADKEMRLAVIISIYTGLRRGNVIGDKGLQWYQVDFTKETITIPRSQLKMHDSSKRPYDLIIPLNIHLLSALKEHHTTNIDTTCFVITNSKKIYNPTTSKLWPKLQVKSGITSIRTWHNLRRSFSNFMVKDRDTKSETRLAIMDKIKTIPSDEGYVEVTQEMMRVAVNNLPYLL